MQDGGSELAGTRDAGGRASWWARENRASARCPFLPWCRVADVGVGWDLVTLVGLASRPAGGTAGRSAVLVGLHCAYMDVSYVRAIYQGAILLVCVCSVLLCLRLACSVDSFDLLVVDVFIDVDLYRPPASAPPLMGRPVKGAAVWLACQVSLTTTSAEPDLARL